jgi:hypothetical protein
MTAQPSFLAALFEKRSAIVPVAVFGILAEHPLVFRACVLDCGGHAAALKSFLRKLTFVAWRAVSPTPLLSPEGCRKLAGGNAPGNCLVILRPERALECSTSEFLKISFLQNEPNF